MHFLSFSLFLLYGLCFCFIPLYHHQLGKGVNVLENYIHRDVRTQRRTNRSAEVIPPRFALIPVGGAGRLWARLTFDDSLILAQTRCKRQQPTRNISDRVSTPKHVACILRPHRCSLPYSCLLPSVPTEHLNEARNFKLGKTKTCSQ